jgi:nucleotide-binding universal stress UspA family protein
LEDAIDEQRHAEMRGKSMTTEGTSAPHVVVGVDGSAESVGALKWAAHYAAATGAAVRAVLCWHDPAAVGTAPTGKAPTAITDEVRAEMQETLDKALTEVFGTAAPSRVQPEVAYGHPAEVLVDESRHADLLVVANRGHGQFTSMLAGSVSMQCVTHAACPAVVVRGDT